MKRLVLILAFILTVGGFNAVFAQGKYGKDSVNCIRYLSYYKEYFQQRDYESALPNWRKAYKICPPTANQTMLIDGAFLMRKLIAKNRTNAQYKAKLLDSLMTLHDVRAKYYPRYAVVTLNNKGIDVINYMQDNEQAMFDNLNKIIATNGNKVLSSILLLDLKAAIDLHRAGKLDVATVLNTYKTNTNYMNNILSSPTATNMDKKIKDQLEDLFVNSKVASCNDLIALFTPKFKANPNDLDLVKNIVKLLSLADNCTNNDLFIDAANALNRLEPSAQSAYFLYQLYSAKNDVKSAIKYLEQAITYNTLTNAQKSDYEYQLAAFCFNSSLYAKAMEAAKKAAELNKANTGKSYYLIASIWTAIPCKGDDISKRAKYWVATDYLQKAKEADPSMKTQCDNLIRQYRKYYPTASDAFMYNLTNGQKYTLKCSGFEAVTRVKTQQD